MNTAYAIYKICTYYTNSEFKFVQGQKKNYIQIFQNIHSLINHISGVLGV